MARDDAAVCHECGGLCCCLYLAHDENGHYIGDGWLPDYIDLWLGRLSASGALTVTDSAHEAGATLPEWVDTRKCQFCHPDTGCLLPRRFRAPICGQYRCELLQGRR
jgi:hypothetical protein